MKNPILDLHGIRHYEVDIMVENFIYKNQNHLPALIICGNSNAMIRLVHEKLETIRCRHEMARYGVIRVYGL
jgi:hypothetical protein